LLSKAKQNLNALLILKWFKKTERSEYANELKVESL